MKGTGRGLKRRGAALHKKITLKINKVARGRREEKGEERVDVFDRESPGKKGS